MTKIMLVEDDNNLREIYEARLLAEGYEIVSAKDGEEALALAVKEKPDLIISDVMMPKISGFDMLDILRSTPEIRDTKVIMMTALSQSEDKSRADKLGADRYLVKSQVTLEDVAKVAREVLNGEESAPSVSLPGASAGSGTSPLATGPVPAEPPATPTPDPVTPPIEPSDPPEPPTPPVPTPPTTPPEPPVAPAAPTTSPPPPAPVSLPAEPAASSAVDPPSTVLPAPTPAVTLPEPPAGNDINNPASDPLPLDPIAAAAAPDLDTAQSAAEETATVDDQIQDFVAQPVPAGGNDAAEETKPAAAAVQPDESDVLDQADASTSTAALPSGPPVEEIAVKDAPPQDAQPTETAAVPPPPAPAEPPVPTPPVPETKSPTNDTDDNAPVAHKKVITPISPTAATPPDLADLLAKQKQKDALAPAAPSVPPVTSVIEPGGKTITPATAATPTDTTQPGNVVHPAGGDPASIAL